MKSKKVSAQKETVSHREDSPLRALIRSYGLVQRHMQPYFARFGITGAQWGVLRVLDRQLQEGNERIRLVDLSELLLIQPPSVTGVVDRLEKMGLVVREGSPSDLRSKYLRLTEEGRSLVAQIVKGHEVQVAHVLAGLNAREQREFKKLLEKLSAHLEELSQFENEDIAPTGTENF